MYKYHNYVRKGELLKTNHMGAPSLLSEELL